ncbi:hypothetical protein MMC15_000688 [Xylographa vitiligo]|nr:hypothetical protein [Xylographa vitiligo]
MGSTSSKDAIVPVSAVDNQNIARWPSQNLPHDNRHVTSHSSEYQHHQYRATRDKSSNSVLLDRIQGLKEELRGEKNKVAVSNQSYHRAQDEVTELQTTCATLQLDLAACKHDLFSLQPCNQISDTEIAEKVEYLSQQILQWSDEALKNIDTMYQGLEENILCEHENCPIARSRGAESDKMLKHIPSAAEVFMHHVIFRHLQQRVFDEGNYLFGLNTQNGWF